jgi:hypothetical protein
LYRGLKDVHDQSANGWSRFAEDETETGVRLAICDCLSLATVVLLNALGAAALESQNRKPDPGFVFYSLMNF